MKAILLDDLEVEIDERLMDTVGGAWNGSVVNGVLHAAEGGGVLRFLWGELCKLEWPVLLDIGASTGSSCLFARFMEMSGVHAFEPMPFACDILRSNVSLNGLDDIVVVHEVALTDHEGLAELKIPSRRDYAGYACLGRPLRCAQLRVPWQSTAVKTRRLDSLELGLVDVIKMDTEGCELMVLIGGEQTIRSWMPSILLEYQPRNTAQFGYRPQKIVTLLESWGYKSFLMVGEEDMWVTR